MNCQVIYNFGYNPDTKSNVQISTSIQIEKGIRFTITGEVKSLIQNIACSDKRTKYIQAMIQKDIYTIIMNM